VNESSIRKCCKGKAGSAGGFIWRYKDVVWYVCDEFFLYIFYMIRHRVIPKTEDPGDSISG
jgi:hypothetical protein